MGRHHSSVAATGAGPQALEKEGEKHFRYRFKVLSYVNCVHIGQHFKGDVFCEKYSHASIEGSSMHFKAFSSASTLFQAF